MIQIRDQISTTHRGVNRLRGVRSQVEAWRKRLQDDERVVQAADALLAKLASVEDTLILPGEHKDTFGLNDRVRLNAALTSLLSVVNSADVRPTQQARELAAETSAKINGHLATLDQALDSDLGALNDLIMASEVAPIGAGEE
ncbi:MAG: hypothetical protein HC802_21700 [Caldilineaceae bacterium]|nr:hypothetical protein [Caldilineaceae bacterium]